MRFTASMRKITEIGAFVAVSAMFGMQAMAQSGSYLANASGLTDTGKAAGLGGGSTDLPVIIGRIIGAALGLMGAVFVVLIIYAGFTWMTAQGSDEKIKQAKKTLSSAVIGIVLVFSAYVITNFVVSSLANSINPPNPYDPGY